MATLTIAAQRNPDTKLPIGLFDDTSDNQASQSPVIQPSDPGGERRIRQTIEDNAQQNASLLNDIMTTADAVSELNNSQTNLIRAKEELAKQDQEVEKAALSTGVYQLRYIQRRDGRLSKWFYIITRMREEFQAKVAQAEKLYHEAIKAQTQLEQRQQGLEQDVRLVEERHAEIGIRAKKHGTAHKELDDLYALIFDGPTPGFPDEDEQEDKYNAKKSQHRESSQALRKITRGRKEGDAIGVAIEKAAAELERAAEESDSAFFVSDYITIVVQRFGRYLDQALRLSKETVDSLPKPLTRDLLTSHGAMAECLTAARQPATEAIEAGYLARSEITATLHATNVALDKAAEAHGKFLSLVKKCEDNATRVVTKTSRQYEDARQGLQAIRQSAFEVTVGFGAAAPAYHECCDRADAFADDAFAQCRVIEVPPITEEGLPPPPSYERTVQSS
jgi:hypothetical protein